MEYEFNKLCTDKSIESIYNPNSITDLSMFYPL